MLHLPDHLSKRKHQILGAQVCDNNYVCGLTGGKVSPCQGLV